MFRWSIGLISVFTPSLKVIIREGRRSRVLIIIPLWCSLLFLSLLIINRRLSVVITSILLLIRFVLRIILLVRTPFLRGLDLILLFFIWTRLHLYLRGHFLIFSLFLFLLVLFNLLFWLWTRLRRARALGNIKEILFPNLICPPENMIVKLFKCYSDWAHRLMFHDINF